MGAPVASLSPTAHPPAYRVVRTKDADIAFSLSAPLTGDIAAALIAADFQKHFSGEHTPPITEYRLGSDDNGFYVEFLVPLQGSEVKRTGEPDVTVVKAGVNAQKLRYLDLLLTDPWSLQLTPELGVPVQAPLGMMVRNPVTFIAQKILIRKYRQPDKQSQDALYIHERISPRGAQQGLIQ